MRLLLHRFHPSRSALCSVLAVSIFYVAALCLLEKRGFWITDNGNKFLQVQALANSDFTDFSIPWPGRAIDPDFVYNPLPYHFTVVESGQLYSVFSPVFALVSALFFSYLGHWGLYLLPALSSLALLVGLAQIARLCTPRIAVGHIAVLTAGLCTPLFFYSLVLWEHTPAICLGIWSVRYLLYFLTDAGPKNLALGMVAAGLSVYFRDEFYLLCLVLLLSTAFYAKKNRLKTLLTSAAILFLALVPLWLLQWLKIGHPFGHHLSTHLATVAGLVQHLVDRPRVFYNLFLAANPIPALSLSLSLWFVISFVLHPRFSPKSFQRAIPLYAVLGLLSAGLSLGGYLFYPSPIDYMLKSSNAFFPCSPFVALAFLRLGSTEATSKSFAPSRWLWLVALGFATLYALSAPKLGSMGIHWGNRYFLILYPLFAILAAVNLVKFFDLQKTYSKLGACCVGAVLALSFAAQLYAISILAEKKTFSHRLNNALAQRPEEVVITNQRWVPQALSSQFYQKSLFYVATPQDFDRLLQQLSNRGFKAYIFIAQHRSGPLKPAVAIDDGRLNYFGLQFFAEKIHND